MTQRAWDELIADGEELKIMEDRIEAEAGNIRWLWGDLALEVAPMGGDHTNNGSKERLERFADELDMPLKTLLMYRTVAEKWPDAMRIASQPWAVHQQIMGREDREELIGQPVDVRTGEVMERWTFRAMQRFLGHKPSPHYIAPPSSVGDKADLVTEYLADAEVASAAFEDASSDVISNVLEALTKPGSKSLGEPLVKTFDERCGSWVQRLNGLMMEGAKLSSEAETEGHASDAAPSHLAMLLYQRMSERKFDIEIRQLLEAEGA